MSSPRSHYKRFSTVPLVALVLLLTAAAPASAVTTSAPSIELYNPQPGYRVVLLVHDVDWSKGPLTLHAFTTNRTFASDNDLYHFYVAIPASTTPGTYRIWATQQNRVVVEQYSYMPPLRPRITPSSWYVYAGDVVKFRGYGYLPGETVEIEVDGKPTGVTWQAGNAGPIFYDNQGALQSDFLADPPLLGYEIPDSMKGKTSEFQITGHESGAAARASITVAG